MANRTLLPPFGSYRGYGRDEIDRIVEGRSTDRPIFWRYWSPGIISCVDDFSDADTDETLTLNTKFSDEPLPSNVMVGPALIQVIALPAGTSWTNYNIEVGDAGDTNENFEAVDLMAESIDTIVQPTTLGTKFATSNYQWGYYESAYEPVVRCVVTGGNHNVATAGKFRILLPYSPVGLLASS